MNKAILKEKWGSYTDTDKLVDDVMALLTKYHHKNSEYGVCKMLDTYFTNKQSLIDLFMKSEYYAGNMRIIMNKEFERDRDGSQIRNCVSNFLKNTNAKDFVLSDKDDDGKTARDYMKVGIKAFNINDLETPDFLKTLNMMNEKLSAFDSNGMTVASVDKFSNLEEIMNYFAYYYNSKTDERLVDNVNKINSDIKAAVDMKTSRLFNRVCTQYDINKSPKYNKLFAQYSDLVADGSRNLKFVVSLNPYDYLTMSFGKRWSSCHTIDKLNKRNMPNAYSGMYCGGTLSYMLDEVSIITYVMMPNDNLQEDGKLYRNMFHFDTEANVLIQGRVYPQGNDGATDLYKKFRDFMQTELALLIGLNNNLWKIKRGYEVCSGYTISDGVHYPDYANFSDCNVSYPSEIGIECDYSMTIGHDGVCPNCGESITSSGALSHTYECAQRGENEIE